MKNPPTRLSADTLKASLPTAAGGLFRALSCPQPLAVEPSRWEALLSRLEAAQKAPEAYWSDDEEGDDPESGYRVTPDGTAVIPIHGPMVDAAPDFWTWLFGLCSTPQVTGWVREAAADFNVKRIFLDVDSPGGQASGVGTLADAVFSASASGKEVWAGCKEACSAAYWVASQADRLIARPDGMMVCVGTVIGLWDTSEYFGADGIKRLRITSSGAETYKGAGMLGDKISKEQEADFKRTCDEVQTLFDAGIARGRGISLEAAHEIATGQVYLGYVAAQMGLVDEASDPDKALAAFGGVGTAAKQPPPMGMDPDDHEEETRKKKRMGASNEAPDPTATNSQTEQTPPSVPGAGESPGHPRTGGQSMTLTDRLKAAFAGGSETKDEVAEAAASQIATLTTERDTLKTENATLKAAAETHRLQIEAGVTFAKSVATAEAVRAYGAATGLLSMAKASIEVATTLDAVTELIETIKADRPNTFNPDNEGKRVSQPGATKPVEGNDAEKNAALESRAELAVKSLKRGQAGGK